MKAPFLENQRVRLSLLDLSNYEHLLSIANQDKLVQFSPSKIDKVEFRVDERNIASRKAVEKIGGTLEGVLRKNILMLDGFKRSTCCYGILKEEWGEIKTKYF